MLGYCVGFLLWSYGGGPPLAVLIEVVNYPMEVEVEGAGDFQLWWLGCLYHPL